MLCFASDRRCSKVLLGGYANDLVVPPEDALAGTAQDAVPLPPVEAAALGARKGLRHRSAATTAPCLQVHNGFYGDDHEVLAAPLHAIAKRHLSHPPFLFRDDRPSWAGSLGGFCSAFRRRRTRR